MKEFTEAEIKEIDRRLKLLDKRIRELEDSIVVAYQREEEQEDEDD